jgi:hypothetical protein
MAVAALGASAALCSPDGVAAQTSDRARITVSPTIVAQAASEPALAIEVGPAHVVPPRSFVSLRGVPHSVALTEGHLVAPGAWAVSLSALPFLKARIPSDVSGRADIVIRLIGMDGRLLAQATTALIVEPPAGRLRPPPAAAGAPAQLPSAPVAPQSPAPKAGRSSPPA